MHSIPLKLRPIELQQVFPHQLGPTQLWQVLILPRTRSQHSMFKAKSQAMRQLEKGYLEPFARGTGLAASQVHTKGPFV